MVTLSTAHDYVVLFALAGLFGAVGGMAYELTLTRKKRTGTLQFPAFDRWHLLELGFVSSMFLGAVAAVAISYFFTPEVQVKTVVNGTAVIQTKWQIVKVIPLSLIVGSSGGAFLEAMRSRVLGQLNAQKVTTTQNAAKAAVVQVGRMAKTVTGQPANTAARIASGARGHIAEDFRIQLADLAPDVVEALHRQEPVEQHVETVRTVAHDVLSADASAASDVIDASVDAALATIDAAAEA